MQRDDATLLDILKAARLAVVFKGDLDKSAFLVGRVKWEEGLSLDL